ncbi:MAG: MmcQ/YjbR family DNA-binding protein [Saprospiraceae bacterium]
MVSNESFRELALSFQGVEENAHFERRAFKVVRKRIFATLHEEQRSANIKLSLEVQKLFCAYDKKGIYSVSNKWGLQGWTTFDLMRVPVELISEALFTAYNDVFKKMEKKN